MVKYSDTARVTFQRRVPVSSVFLIFEETVLVGSTRSKNRIRSESRDRDGNSIRGGLRVPLGGTAKHFQGGREKSR